MDAVARELRVSRATVSRLLARARESGIVEITVFTPGARASQLSKELHDRHGVEALVVPLQEGIPVEERHARTAEAAADALRQVVTSDAVLAVAWGTMTHAISLHLPPKAVTNCSVVQVNGMGNSAGIGVHYAHAMMDRFGHAFGARVQENPLPLFLDSAEVAAMLRADRLLSGVTQAIETADVFLFNVGTVTGGVPSAPPPVRELSGGRRVRHSSRRRGRGGHRDDVLRRARAHRPDPAQRSEHGTRSRCPACRQAPDLCDLRGAQGRSAERRPRRWIHHRSHHR